MDKLEARLTLTIMTLRLRPNFEPGDCKAILLGIQALTRLSRLANGDQVDPNTPLPGEGQGGEV